MEKKRVLMTGAAGFIAGLLIDELENLYELRLIDILEKSPYIDRVLKIEKVNLVTASVFEIQKLFEGVDSIVHCANIRSRNKENIEEQYLIEQQNLKMAFNVFYAASCAKVRRVVVAGSNHAVGYFQNLIFNSEYALSQNEDDNFPESLYGWAKTSIEKLGFYFAQKDVNSVENIHIRIGVPKDSAIFENKDKNQLRRALALYISQRDLTQIFAKSIDTVDIRNNLGVPFQVFFGTSGNSLGIYNINNALEIIGYRPIDNSSAKFQELALDFKK
jgi:nucleoside-diphosphate-sugar epimerase